MGKRGMINRGFREDGFSHGYKESEKEIGRVKKLLKLVAREKTQKSYENVPPGLAASKVPCIIMHSFAAG